ncbi:MAG: hypothetical protein GF317_19265 [Candidatus Lokiarchaeota archaeon]|nr:hypothetical protein [Candidatus Lokiarchaeota archaeon]
MLIITDSKSENNIAVNINNELIIYHDYDKFFIQHCDKIYSLRIKLFDLSVHFIKAITSILKNSDSIFISISKTGQYTTSFKEIDKVELTNDSAYFYYSVTKQQYNLIMNELKNELKGGDKK